MANYDEAVVTHVMQTARRTRDNAILFDGGHIALLFEENIGLIDALTTKIDAAEQEGKLWQPRPGRIRG